MKIEIRYDRGLTPVYGDKVYDDCLSFDIEPSGKENVEISSDGHKKKKTESKKVKEILNKILECNYQKVFFEMGSNLGLDGTSLSVKAGDFFNNVEVHMWLPSVERFKESGWKESARLLSYVMELLVIAESLGYQIDPGLKP